MAMATAAAQLGDGGWWLRSRQRLRPRSLRLNLLVAVGGYGHGNDYGHGNGDSHSNGPVSLAHSRRNNPVICNSNRHTMIHGAKLQPRKYSRSDFTSATLFFNARSSLGPLPSFVRSLLVPFSFRLQCSFSARPISVPLSFPLQGLLNIRCHGRSSSVLLLVPFSF